MKSTKCFLQSRSISLLLPPEYPSSKQGFVGITSGEIGEPGHYVAAFHTPIKAGSVRIAQANGVIFTLTTDNGIIVMFNAETETFLTRPPANYPTATPGQPLPTPTWKP